MNKIGFLRFLTFTFVISFFSGCSLFSPADDKPVVTDVPESSTRGVPTTGGMVIDIKTKEQYDAIINDSVNNPFVIVDFWGPWCPPCRRMKPINKTIAALYPEVRVLELQADNASLQSIKSELGVVGIPDFSFIVGGNIEGRGHQIGAMSLDDYIGLIEKYFGLPRREVGK